MNMSASELAAGTVTVTVKDEQGAAGKEALTTHWTNDITPPLTYSVPRTTKGGGEGDLTTNNITPPPSRTDKEHPTTNK